MFNFPPLGPSSTEQPQKRRIFVGAQDVYTLRIWCRSSHAFPRYGLRKKFFPIELNVKIQPPAPGAPMGRSSANYLIPVPGVCSTLSQNFTPIAPSCVEISSTVQKKTSKLNITPNATLYGEIIKQDHEYFTRRCDSD